MPTVNLDTVLIGPLLNCCGLLKLLWLLKTCEKAKGTTSPASALPRCLGHQRDLGVLEAMVKRPL
jgi:hypothetical protein